MMRKAILYEDRPIEKFTASHGRALWINEKEVLLFPGSLVSAVISIPEHFRTCHALYAHTRSTWARLGINAAFDQGVFQEMLKEKRNASLLPQKTTVSVQNWNAYPVMLRTDDTIVLTNYSEMLMLPVRERILLHVGGQYLQFFPECFARFEHVPYLDPRSPNVAEQTRMADFSELTLLPNQFCVLLAKEHVTIPENHIGLLHVIPGSVPQRLRHNTANLCYPGWEGRLTLEVQAYEEMIVWPGMDFTHLTIHESPHPLPLYTGRYGNQHSAAPRAQ